MAGIQRAISEATTVATGIAVAGRKLHDNERQAAEKLSAETKAKEERAAAEVKAKEERAAAEVKAKEVQAKAIQEEAKTVSIEADLVKMGADPDKAKSFMDARALGLDTKQFGMVRNKGKFVGSYATLADKLSKNALADSLTSRTINEKGFAERVVALGGSRRGRVDALVKASKGGKK